MKAPLYGLLAALVVLFNNCSDVTLTGRTVASLSQPSMGQFCVAEPQTTARYTKFLFVVDKSGSNRANPGTDPSNVRRADNIERFYNEKKSNEYIKWGYIVFGRDGSRAEGYVNEGGDRNKPIFADGNSGQMEAAIGLQRSELDNGCTPYANALSLSRSAIINDIAQNPLEDSSYMVFFMSDGAPTDYSGATGGCGNPMPPGQPAFNDVAALVALKPGKIFFSTAYYGPNNPANAEGLRKMAEDYGHGKFINLESTDTINFNDLIVEGPTKDPWQIKNSMLMVYNVSSAICEDNKYDADSDSDGVCDRDEHAYTVNGRTITLDPTKRYSQSTLFPHYSDYFVWRHIKYGEILNPCNDPDGDLDVDHDLLNTCEERYIYNANPRGVLDHTGDARNPDTDMDGFIDGIETLVFRTSIGYAMNSFNMMDTFDFENVSAATQVRQHRNPMVYDPNAFAYDTMVMPTGINALGQSCYSFTQNNLLLYPTKAVTAQNVLPEHQHGADENVVMMYYIQTPQRDPASKGVLMYSNQRLLRSAARINGYGVGAGLKLNQFKSYTVPQ